MVFNESIILGGPIPLVVWNGFLAIIALTAFAACLEGYLFAPIVLWQRLLIVPGVIAVFWPDITFEVIGAATLVVILSLNWSQGRREQSPKEMVGEA
jgi:TRAP-type uncharacterized transport system fused permease subunit